MGTTGPPARRLCSVSFRSIRSACPTWPLGQGVTSCFLAAAVELLSPVSLQTR